MVAALFDLLFSYSSSPRLYRFAFIPIPLADLQIYSEMPVDLYQPGIAQPPLILVSTEASFAGLSVAPSDSSSTVRIFIRQL